MPAVPSTPIFGQMYFLSAKLGAWETRERTGLSFSSMLSGLLPLHKGSQAEFEERSVGSAAGDFKMGSNMLQEKNQEKLLKELEGKEVSFVGGVGEWKEE